MNTHLIRTMGAVPALLACLAGQAQTPSALNAREFDKHWTIESEAPDYRLTFVGADTAEIVSPKGLTLWRREKMQGSVVIEYDACVMDEGRPGDRLSDLNCFWMARDPQNPGNIGERARWRSGIFVRCYTLQLYYLGYGGNHNSTTRFRRYDGNPAAIDDASARPAILREYLDADHLLQPNHWYHIRIENSGGRVRYTIDGRTIVDFADPEPLTWGWFGFRTTASRTRIANFRYAEQPDTADVPLQWIGAEPLTDTPVAFGIPFAPGRHKGGAMELAGTDGRTIEADTWTLASWPDGSVKWLGVSVVVPAGQSQLTARPTRAGKRRTAMATQSDGRIEINTGCIRAYISEGGRCLIDSLMVGTTTVGRNLHLVCSTQSRPADEAAESLTFARYASHVERATVERSLGIGTVVRLEGRHTDGHRQWLPFVVRLYFHRGSDRIRMTHTFVFDGDENSDFVRGLGVRIDVPMRTELYNRHIAFATDCGGVWSEPVQPLSGRRRICLGDTDLQQLQMSACRVPAADSLDPQSRQLVNDWASWNEFRLTQTTPDAFAIRKRTHADRPWIGTMGGHRATGYAFAGDTDGGIVMGIKDFWQTYPSAVEIGGACTPSAQMTAWLWSPDAEPMDLRHYDHSAHGLESSYEDVQEGMSTPYGIARTSELCIVPMARFEGKARFALLASELAKPNRLMCTPQYLHSQRAFGIWSLPDTATATGRQVERSLRAMTDYYAQAVDVHRWYGFWNYGDVMHTYDTERHEWKYDVGGYAWDNTELASNMWLWYSFLRTGRAELWTMAEAMTRHTGEVDVYHAGPNAALGSRHNVSHWGCGAKEVRISQAAWNRFYHYLAADERCGDLMTEVKDVERKLAELDPMRLAEPLSRFPCTAPARLRIGPDWIACAGNWMTQWERTGDTAYRDRIVAGMKSIAALPHGIFTGNKALGFDPATGVLTYEGDTAMRNTNHLATIMGGFEVMNELQMMISLPEWNAAWLDHALNYKRLAARLSNNHFRVTRLAAYAAWQLRRPDLARAAWKDLLHSRHSAAMANFAPISIGTPDAPAPMVEVPELSTNDVATWSLDAIYMLEVCPPAD